ncbi:unnamed protein product [Protopolystoma xenopodis]|uniref:Uncharacterized protein n=1 Tax=Protopolystoma xenopodis TaxID=117903 RepID=A0A3S5A4D5_9PLAT|nr:unnamed protein product [Protopolystoma xenopodis]
MADGFPIPISGIHSPSETQAARTAGLNDIFHSFATPSLQHVISLRRVCDNELSQAG